MLATVVQQSESAICVHIPLPFWIKFPELYNMFSLVIYFMHNISSVMCQSQSPNSSHPPPYSCLLKWSESCSVGSNSLWPHRLYSPWNSPGQNTGVGSLSLSQEIFPTQELNQGLLHCRRILYQLSYKGNPGSRIILPLFVQKWKSRIRIHWSDIPKTNIDFQPCAQEAPSPGKSKTGKTLRKWHCGWFPAAPPLLPWWSCVSHGKGTSAPHSLSC